MKNKKINFGIYGLGTVFSKRVANIFLKEIKNIRIKAVYDKDKNKNIKFSKIFNCSFSKNSKEFYKKDFDICYISTDSGSHYQNIIECFKNNKHVVVEKPPVLKVNQLIKLNRICKKKKLNFYVIYQNRENKAVKFVKNYLLSNKNEKIVFVNLKLMWCRKQNYYSRWHGKWKTDGGVLAQQGIHYIDLLCHFFGKPIQAISLLKNVSNKLQAEDTHTSLIKFKRTNCLVGLTTALRPVDSTASIEIYFQKKLMKLHGICCNELSIENYNDIKTNYQKKVFKNTFQKVSNGMGVSHFNFFKEIADKFNNKNGAKPLKAIETLETLKLINMMYSSTEKDQWIKNSNNINSRLGN